MAKKILTLKNNGPHTSVTRRFLSLANDPGPLHPAGIKTLKTARGEYQLSHTMNIRQHYKELSAQQVARSSAVILQHQAEGPPPQILVSNLQEAPFIKKKRRISRSEKVLSDDSAFERKLKRRWSVEVWNKPVQLYNSQDNGTKTARLNYSYFYTNYIYVPSVTKDNKVKMKKKPKDKLVKTPVKQVGLLSQEESIKVAAFLDMIALCEGSFEQYGYHRYVAFNFNFQDDKTQSRINEKLTSKTLEYHQSSEQSHPPKSDTSPSNPKKKHKKRKKLLQNQLFLGI